MPRLIVPLTLLAALAFAATAGAQPRSPHRASERTAIAVAADFMHNNCADGFEWACVDDTYLAPVCAPYGRSSWACRGAVREGAPNRIVTMTVHVNGRRIISSRLHASRRIGADIVR